MLPGFGDAGAAIVDHPDVDKVAFTGIITIMASVYTLTPNINNEYYKCETNSVYLSFTQ